MTVFWHTLKVVFRDILQWLPLLSPSGILWVADLLATGEAVTSQVQVVVLVDDGYANNADGWVGGAERQPK